MIEQLEADLRAALATRASEVPGQSAARLRQIDYGPRSHRVRPPVAFGALAGTAGTAAIVASVVGLGAGASTAFAGWTASPTAASDAQTAGADAACEARLGTLPAPLSSAGLAPVLTDTRGPFTVVIFAGASGNASCISGPSFTAVTGTPAAGSGAPGSASVTRSGTATSPSSMSIRGSLSLATVPAGHVELSTLASTVRGGQPYTVVEGHTGAGVTGATLVLANGSTVTASTANGWFAAWWPGAIDATDANVATPSGVTTQHLDTGGPVQCGPGPCTRSTAGQAAPSVKVTGGDQGGTATTTVTSSSR